MDKTNSPKSSFGCIWSLLCGLVGALVSTVVVGIFAYVERSQGEAMDDMALPLYFMVAIAVGLVLGAAMGEIARLLLKRNA